MTPLIRLALVAMCSSAALVLIGYLAGRIDGERVEDGRWRDAGHGRDCGAPRP